MTIETILIIAGVVLLFLTYKKIDTLTKFFEDKFEEKNNRTLAQQNENFQNWLYEDLKIIKDKIVELSDISSAENPAWGENSATSQKKENLIKLYSQHLVEKEKLSQKDALCKARFVVNNFDGGVVDDIVGDIRFHAEVKSEEELLLSDFFKKEVQEKITTLKAKDIFEPLWIGIKIRKYKKGDELLQNTRKAFEYSGQYGYQNYVEDSAIVSKLEQLEIFGVKKEKTEYSFQESQDRAKLGVSHDASAEEIKSAHVKLAKKYHPDNADGSTEKFTEVNTAYKNLSQKSEVRKTMSGHSFYILKEDDLEKLRKIIFAGDEQNSEYYSDTYFEGEHPKDERFEMPFKKPFEY